MKYKNIILWITVVLMVLSAAVQLNDPDPITWIAAYLLVAYVGFRKIQGKIDQYWIAAAVYFIWALNQFPPEWEGVLLDEMGMKTLNVELGRESFGLMICSLFLALYALIKNK